MSILNYYKGTAQLSIDAVVNHKSNSKGSEEEDT